MHIEKQNETKPVKLERVEKIWILPGYLMILRNHWGVLDMIVSSDSEIPTEIDMEDMKWCPGSASK